MKRAVISEECFDLDRKEIRETHLRDPLLTTEEDFRTALQKVGIRSGMRLVVHSSMASLGNFEGGPEAICRIFQDLVTKEGTLLFPGLVKYPGDGEEYTYDPQTTPVGVGLIPETFRKLPGVVRSLDPTHSFCAWGKDSLYFVRDHHKYPTMHAESPLGRLERAGGSCLQIGCPWSTTFMHVVESSCAAHCLGARTEKYPAVLNGKNVILRGWGWRDGACRALRYPEIFGFLREHGMMSEIMIGRCHMIHFLLSDYRKAYSRLLTGTNGCQGCPVRPRHVRQSVEPDWDFERDCLKPSEAFTGEYFGGKEGSENV